jgi:3-(3-hydroxy-phenyl)propionate hydroxylase
MNEQAPVGIVGAGPVGLALAVRLACFGIPSVILESGPALRREGSKACLIQGDVVEVLDKAGCGQEIADEGVMWHVARTYVRGRQIEMRDYPIPIGYGPFINISQFRIEQVLLEEVNRRPECVIAWNGRLPRSPRTTTA